MDSYKKNRTELKAYFVKNAIPTENNFRDLIDSMLSQKEDGLTKAPGDPLSIEAAAIGEKKAVTLYESFSDPQPAWVLSLLPGVTTGNQVTAKRGLGFRDGAGNSRLFIDAATGNIGIGTLDVAAATLNVAGSLSVSSTLSATGTLTASGGLVVPTSATLTVNGALRATAGASVSGGPLTASSGLSVSGAPLTATNGASISGGALLATAGATVSGGALVINNGATVTGGFISTNGGVSISGGQLIANAGATVAGGPLVVSGHATLSGGLTVPSGGVSVGPGQIIANAGATVNGGLLNVTSGIDIQPATRTDPRVTNSDSTGHPTGLPLYVTGNMDGAGGGVEIRHTNGRSGIGFGYNTIYATGSYADQDLFLTARGAGNVRIPLGIAIDGTRTTHIEADGAMYRHQGNLYITTDDNLYFRNLNATSAALHIDTAGARLGVGMVSPLHKVDIQSGNARTGTHPTSQLGLYVTANSSEASGGVEFRHHNGTVGIGFGHGTIYAAGSNPNQDLSLIGRGTGNVRLPNGFVFDGTRNTHIENDGAFYRYQGQAYLTVDDNLYVRNINSTTNTLHVDTANARLGVGLSTPQNTLDIQSGGTRTLTHPNGLALYVSCNSQEASGGVEFRHHNGTQGIGFGYNTIYATGSLASQPLSIRAKGTSRVSISQEPWQPAALGPGWLIYDTYWPPPSYFMDANGIVHLRGLVKGGTANLICTLPAGYRPDFAYLFLGICNDNRYCRINVYTDGTVTVDYAGGGGTNGWVSLSGIYFKAAGGLTSMA